METVKYDEYILNRKEKLFISFFLCAILGITGNLFFRSFILVLLFPGCIRKVEEIYISYKIKKRKRMLLLQYRDLLYELSSSFSSGRHMEEALRESLGKLSLIYSGNADIVREVSGMLEGIDNGNTDLEVWEDFSLRSNIEDIREFVMVFRVCRETGGDFISVLNRAAALIGEKIVLEDEIKTMMLQKETEGNIIMAMPFILLLFLKICSPSYLLPMYETLQGRLIMLFSLILIIVAYKITEKVVSVNI